MKNEITGMRLRLIVMNFLQFAVWGAYLTFFISIHFIRHPAERT